MRKRIIACFLALIMTSCLSACGENSANSEDTSTSAVEETETEAEKDTSITVEANEFNLDSYREDATQCRDDMMENQLVLYNMASYAVNFLTAYGKASDNTVENAFNWLEEKSNYTKDFVETTDQKIKKEYKALILQDIDGKEAKEIDSGIRDMYTAYSSLYDTILGMDGMTAYEVASDTDEATTSIQAAEDALEVFLGEFDNSIVEENKTSEDSGENTEEENVETLEATPAEEAKSETTSYSAGKYKISDDMPAGEYMLIAASSGTAYFSVTSDANGSDILFNDNFANNSIITVNDGEYLELNKCIAYPFDEWCSVNTLDTTTTDIMVKIGVNLSAGEYQVEAEDGKTGYWCIYNNSRQDDIVENDLFEGTSYVSVEDGQYLVLSNAKIVQ